MRLKDQHRNILKAPKFLLLFKDSDEITRQQVHSWPALHRLMDHGMIEFQKGPTTDTDTYRITEAGKKMLAEVVTMTNGDRA